MNPIVQGIIIGLVVGLVVAGVTFALGRLGRNKERKSDKVLSLELVAIEAVKTRDNRILQLERDVERLQTLAEEQSKAAIPITAAMQAMLIHKLTNSHLPDADALLKKLTDGTLTVDDATEFTKAMEDRETDADPRIGEAQQIAARILPDVIRLGELAEKESGGQVKTVLVTVPETVTIRAKDGGTQEEEKGK